MPKPNIFSAVRYADAPSVISFLVEAFGFARHEVHAAPDGTIAHAELSLGTGLLMLGSATPPDPANPWSAVAAGIYAALATPADVDAHHARAVRAGAEVVRPLETTSYGSREYSARDLEGHLWSFGTYNPSPEGAPDFFTGLRYDDGHRAIDWLERAFGFTRHLVIEGTDAAIAHAELALGPGFVMLGSEPDDAVTNPWAGSRQGTCVALGSPAAVDAHHARATAAGARVVGALGDTPYGARSYTALDSGGHLWTFSTYRPAPKPGAARREVD